MVSFAAITMIAVIFCRIFLVRSEEINIESSEITEEDKNCNQPTFHHLKQLGTSKFLYHSGSKFQNIEMVWEDGSQYCRDAGFQMAIVKNIKEYEEIEHELLQIAGQMTNPGTAFWIAAKVKDSIATFVDESPVLFNVELSDNNVINQQGCIFLSAKRYLTEITFSIGNCSVPHWILCQFPDDSLCYSPPVGKESKRLLFENLPSTHLYYYSNKKSWSSALKICEQNGMQLASIQTEEINSFIYNAISKRDLSESVKLWTSGTFWFSKPPGLSQLVWMTTGEIAGPQFPNKSTWEKSQPSGNVFEKCVSIEFDRNNTEKSLKWHVSHCDQVFEFLCSEPDPCHEFEIPEYGSTFQISTRKYFFSSIQHTWMDSIEFCRSIGMELLSLETSTENILVSYEISDLLKQKNKTKVGYWTSGTDVGQRNEFVWLTTGIRLSAAFTDSIILSSNKLHGLEHCILIELTAQGITFNDADCSSGNNFVCEERNDCKLC